MPVYRLTGLPEIDDAFRVEFPDPREADNQGIIAMGGNLSPGVLLSAYEQGIFPWYSELDPILWWSPDPRFVLPLHELHLSRRDLRHIRSAGFTLTMDRSFREIIGLCAAVPRGPGGEATGTWISPEMIQAYTDLFYLGHAHSVEVYDSLGLAGGLYGVQRGRMFFGESMASVRSGASKAALLALVYFLSGAGVRIIDSQVANPHMQRLGGRDISREEYLAILRQELPGPDIGGWNDFRIQGDELVDWYQTGFRPAHSMGE